MFSFTLLPHCLTTGRRGMRFQGSYQDLPSDHLCEHQVVGSLGCLGACPDAAVAVAADDDVGAEARVFGQEGLAGRASGAEG